MILPLQSTNLSAGCSCVGSGWNKTSLSVDASEENEGYSSGEDPMNSDTEDDGGKKLVRLLHPFARLKVYLGN